MKNKFKILILFLFICTYTITLSSDLYIKGNFGVKEKLPFISINDNIVLNNSKKHTDNGIRLEYFINKNIGFGLGYSKFSSYKNTKVFNEVIKTEYKIPEIEYIPIYFIIKYNFYNNFYLKSNLGYSYNIDKGDLLKLTDNCVNLKKEHYNFNVTNGMYYSLGIGYEHKNFIMELSYDVNKLKYNIDNGQHYKFNRERYTLSIGVKLF